MTFRGWPAEAVEFYEGLAADNSKTYWAAHKATYDTHVYAPMAALVAELEPEFGAARIYRPYRDVRFSADKSPYKTTIAAVLDSGYVQFSAAGLAVGAGMYMMAPDQLDRYRRAVADDTTGPELEKVIAAVTGAGIAVEGHGRLKTAPKGYPKDHPRVGLLRNKGLVAWKQWPVGRWLGTAAAGTRVVTVLRAARPLTDWFDTRVGPSSRA